MDIVEISELVELTDRLVLAKTGKSLNPLQRAILEGTLQKLKYCEIAKEVHLSESHVINAGSELWKMLSEVLGKEIKKASFKRVIKDRVRSTNFVENGLINCGYVDNSYLNKINEKHITINNKVNADKTKKRSPTANQNPEQSPKQPLTDLGEAPENFYFCPRVSEISTLKEWILQYRSRLVSIFGLSGIGKSAIAVQLIPEIQHEFDYIIWRTLSNQTTLTTLQTNLIKFISQQQETQLSTVLEYFRDYRCLLIIDDLQTIFSKGNLAGQYLPGYEDYGTFFERAATLSHQSCLLLLSWEKPREVAALEGKKFPVRGLQLQGLGESAKEILREKELEDEEKWSELIELSWGHPAFLNIVANAIQDLFNGSVSQFLAYQTSLFLGDIEPILQKQLDRLSELEKQIICWMAHQTADVDISSPLTDLELSPLEFLTGIQSLGRRCLVEKLQVEKRSQFALHPLFKQYIQAKQNR
jgi:hypothetical protein